MPYLQVLVYHIDRQIVGRCVNGIDAHLVHLGNEVLLLVDKAFGKQSLEIFLFAFRLAVGKSAQTAVGKYHDNKPVAFGNLSQIRQLALHGGAL